MYLMENTRTLAMLVIYRSSYLFFFIGAVLTRLNPSRLKRRSGGPATITPSLLGEMLLHSNQVKVTDTVPSAIVYLMDDGVCYRLSRIWVNMVLSRVGQIK